MKRARALMIQGTASHVGKSVLTAAFARWIQQLGNSVAPFKAQNMSLNSFVTLKGEEIARSQAVQAEALGLEPTADMNPVLLKPMGEGSQVVVQGKGRRIMSIRQYYESKHAIWKAICESYDRLAEQYDFIVLEGAGSPAEINLREHDLVNMRMAEYAVDVVILAVDIERGGAFAQLVGTWELLSERERDRFIGFVINKFRGDPGLLHSGIEYVRQRTGREILGVLPFDEGVQLDEEDSLGLPSGKNQSKGATEIVAAVLELPGISNFTDFAPLARCPGMSVRYVRQPSELQRADLIIVPGTRTTVRALDWLRSSGLAERLQTLARRPDGPIILGVCGGMQILGQAIEDPEGVESAVSRCDGLGLLDVETCFVNEKSLYRVEGTVVAEQSPGHGSRFRGYEIHQGRSRRLGNAKPWLQFTREPGGERIDDGAVSPNGRILGTYVHGLFDDARFCRSLLAELRASRRLPPLSDSDWRLHAEASAKKFQRLVPWLEAHCNLQPVVRALSLNP